MFRILDRNAIRIVSNESFSQLPESAVVSMDGNPLACKVQSLLARTNNTYTSMMTCPQVIA